MMPAGPDKQLPSRAGRILRWAPCPGCTSRLSTGWLCACDQVMLNGTLDLKTGRLSGWPDLIAWTFKLAKSSLVGYRFETQGSVIFFFWLEDSSRGKEKWAAAQSWQQTRKQGPQKWIIYKQGAWKTPSGWAWKPWGHLDLSPVRPSAENLAMLCPDFRLPETMI